jgi:hypothetical protein
LVGREREVVKYSCRYFMPRLGRWYVYGAPMLGDRFPPNGNYKLIGATTSLEAAMAVMRLFCG